MIIPMTLIKHFDWQNVRVMESLSSSYDFGIVAMGPAAVIAEKKKFKEILIVGIILFCCFIFNHWI